MSTPHLLIFSSCMKAPALLTLTPSMSTPTLLTLTPAQAFPPSSHTLCTHPLTLHTQYTYSCLAHPLTSQMCTHGLSVHSHLPCTLTPCMCAQPLHVRSHPARTLSLVLLLVPCTRASWRTFRGASLAQPHFNSPQKCLFPAYSFRNFSSLPAPLNPKPCSCLPAHGGTLRTWAHWFTCPSIPVDTSPCSLLPALLIPHPSIRLSICLTPSHARCWAPFSSLFISGSQLLLAPPRCSLHPSFSPSLAPAVSHHSYRSLAHIPPPSLPPFFCLSFRPSHALPFFLVISIAHPLHPQISFLSIPPSFHHLARAPHGLASRLPPRPLTRVPRVPLAHVPPRPLGVPAVPRFTPLPQPLKFQSALGWERRGRQRLPLPAPRRCAATLSAPAL